MTKVALTIALLLFVTAAGAAKVYRWVDEDGKVHFSQTRPKEHDAQSKNYGARSSVSPTPEYCEAWVKIAKAVATGMRRGVPVDEMVSRATTLEQRYREEIKIVGPVFRQIVYFVYQYRHGSASPSRISVLAQNKCLNTKIPSNVAIKDKESADSTIDSMGTAWPVGGGYVVTNHHVVRGHKSVTLITTNGERIKAHVIAQDKKNDIAIVRPTIPGVLPPSIPVTTIEAQIGTAVFTIGYPHPDIMGSKPKLTNGIVNAVTGIRNDPRIYQISVPLQAGNSGGPLMNMQGEVIGIVTAKLSAVALYKWTGDLPQNVNYAMKAQYVLALLNSTGGDESHERLASKTGDLVELSSRIQDSIMIITAP